MSGNRDFIEILREIRGSGQPGQPYTNGIWYELTIADKNGNDGIYGDILAKYGVIAENSPTLEQAVAILENLNVVVTTLPYGSEATSELVNGVWQLGIPKGKDGINGTNGTNGTSGYTPVPVFEYDPVTGNLTVDITYEVGTIEVVKVSEV